MTSKPDPILSGAAGNTSRYNIPVGHLDFDYINRCTDTKELEKIFVVLKSGDEGFYPQLQQRCEERLKELNPNSRILRKENPVSTKADLDHNEWQELDKDLKDWTSGMRCMDDNMKSGQPVVETTDDDLPPVRSGAITLTSQGAKTTIPPSNKKPLPREYRDWDKIDVEKELEKIDDDGKPKGRSFVDGKEIKGIPEHIDTKGMTDSEKLMKANREKDKGNEAFKAGDYKEAIVYYSRSISLQPTAASYNNRALAYLKTEDWMKAITDTDKVLKLEPDNLKALLRQATARKGLKQFDKAQKDLEKVLEKEPNNKRAQDLLQEVEKERKEKKAKGRRIVIEDVDGSDEEAEDDIKESVKGDNLAEKTKGNNSVNTADATTSNGKVGGVQVSNTKSTPLVTSNDAKMVNGKVEGVQVTDTKSTPLVNGYAGGDKSKDIWDSDETEISSQQSRVSTNQKGDASKQGNTQVRTEDKTGQSGDKIRDGAKTESVNKAENLDNVKKEKVNRVEVNTDLEEVNLVKDSESDARDESEKESLSNVTGGNDEENDDGDDDDDESGESQDLWGEKTEAVSLKRPVFYQKPFPDSCLKLREEGNTLFKNGQYGEACNTYTKIISILERADDQTVNLSLMYSNRAASQLKIGDLSGCVKDCTKSLELIPHSVKPLLRRAIAYEHLERPRMAYIDYRHVLLLDGRMDQAHFGTKRCQELLHQKDGPRWREKFQLPSVAPWQIPEIYDVDGKPTSQVVFNNPVPALSPTCSAVQSNLSKQNSEKVGEDKKSSATAQSNVSTQSNTPSQSNSSTQNKEKIVEEKKKEVKELSAAEKFEKYKAEGNEFVKKGKFSEAVDSYNKCMEVMPDQVAIYTNRALCFNKLNKAWEAEADCTKALSIEKDNVKALFRRAQARKMLCHNREGIEDLNHLLKLDPKNTAAKKEMEVMKKLWREELDKLKKNMPVVEEKERKAKDKEKTIPKQRKRMVIEEVESDEESEGETKKGAPAKSKQETVKPKVEEIHAAGQNKPHKPVNSQDSKQQLSGNDKVPDRKPAGKESEKPTDGTPVHSAPKDSKKSKKKSQIKETSAGLPKVSPSVPKLEKATPYEFITSWNSLKKSASFQPYYDLLRQIPAKDLSSVISNKLDGPMLNVMTTCVADYYLPKGEKDEAYHLLKNLSTVSRFGTVSMFMSSKEQSRVKSIFETMAASPGSYSQEDIQKLKKDYRVK